MAGRRVLITGVANAFATRLAHLLAADAGVDRVVGVDTRPVAHHGPDAAEDRALVLELSEEVLARVQEKVYDSLVNREGAL